MESDTLCDQITRLHLNREEDIRHSFHRLLETKEKMSSKLKISKSSQHKASEPDQEDISSADILRDYFAKIQPRVKEYSILGDKKEPDQILPSFLQYQEKYQKREILRTVHRDIQDILNEIAEKQKKQKQSGLAFLLPEANSIFSLVRRIYSSQAEETYMSGYRSQIENCFQIYSPYVYDKIQERLHEVLIHYILQSEKLIDGLPYCYGGFYSRVQTDKIHFFSIYESMHYPSLLDVMDILPEVKLIQMILMLSYTLYQLYISHQFHHRSLRLETIRLKPIRSRKYKFKDYIFVCDTMPMITDLRQSSVYVKNNWIGSSEAVSPMFDLWSVFEELKWYLGEDHPTVIFCMSWKRIPEAKIEDWITALIDLCKSYLNKNLTTEI